MDFVADDFYFVVFGEANQFGELVCLVYQAYGVVWVAQEVRGGVVGEGLFQFCEVQVPVNSGAGEWDLLILCVCFVDSVEEWGIDGGTERDGVVWTG